MHELPGVDCAAGGVVRDLWRQSVVSGRLFEETTGPCLDPSAAVMNDCARGMLLEADAAFVRRLEFVSSADILTVDADHGIGPVAEDLQQEPLLVLADNLSCRCDAVETPGGVCAVRSIETLHLDRLTAAVEEYAAVAIDNCFDPHLQLERAFELPFRGHLAIGAFAGERVVFDAPVCISARVESIHPGLQQAGPLLLVRQRPDLDVPKIGLAADVLYADEAFAQSVSESFVLLHVDVMDERSVERDAKRGPVAFDLTAVPLA